jgi:hypothetical protein
MLEQALVHRDRFRAAWGPPRPCRLRPGDASSAMARSPMIDARRTPEPVSSLGPRWQALTDTVMGGITTMSLATEADADGRFWLRMRGRVRLENDGGFLQMALDLDPGGGPVDASVWRGLRLLVRGNGETYGVHLRTTAVIRPWQSYRATFVAPAGPTWVELPWSAFTPHRLTAPFDPSRLRRLGLVAIGRAFDADLALGELAFLV